jgi:hypothetical protein
MHQHVNTDSLFLYFSFNVVLCEPPYESFNLGLNWFRLGINECGLRIWSWRWYAFYISKRRGWY